MGKFSNTWSLMGDSFRVLKQDKEMLLFPLLSGICCLLVLASFAIPIISSESYQPPSSEASIGEQVSYYGALFAFYFCNYFVIIFFNSAIVACAAKRMAGENPTLADGFRAAFVRIHTIIGWALIAATVGLILRIIEDRSKKVGAIIAAVLGAAWTMMSFLAVPILVIENKGPFAALKDSTKLLKETWGEQLISNFSFGLVFFLLFLPAILIVVLGAMAGGYVLIACIVIAVLYAIVIALIQSTLQVIFQTALYYYARHRQAPAGFAADTLSGAVGFRE